MESIERGMVVWDIGAHIGSFTLKAAEIVGDSGRVIAVEPEPEKAVAAYHLPFEDIQVSMALSKLRFETDIKFVRGSVYMNPFSPSIPIVIGSRK